jgi:hypothetical protein
MRTRHIKTVLGLTLTLAGCRERNEPTSSPPVATSSALICADITSTSIGLDEVSRLGFSGRDLLALAAANRTGPIEWQGAARRGDTFELDLHPVGDARLVERAPAGCPRELRVEVLGTMKTPDGALDETFSTTLVAQTGDIARFDLKLDLDASARFWTRQSMTETTPVTIWGVFTRYGTGGGVAGNLSAPLAVWPFFTTTCSSGVPILNEGIRPSADELLEAVTGPGSMRRPDDSIVPITLTARRLEKGSCYHANSFVEQDDALETTIELEVKPADGPSFKLIGRLDADLSSDGTLGTLVNLHPIVEACSTSGALSTTDFVRRCGDFGVNLSAFDSATVRVDGTMSRAGSGTGATIEIAGLRNAPAQSEIVARFFFGRSEP